MKNKTVLITIWLCIFAILFPVFSTIAEELDSDNYKIIDVTTKGGGTIESSNYSSLLTVNDTITNPTLYSPSYKLFGDPAAAFRPAVPTISCFETTTDGSSNCTTGPTELTEGGMTALCGSGGCYDKARFEIYKPEVTDYQYDTSQSGLVSYWPMDETTGSIVDDKKGSNQGSANGTTIVDGRYSKARSLNGSTDNIEIPTGHGLLSTDITVSMWIYPTSWTHIDHTALVTSRSTNLDGMMFFILSQGNLHFDWGGADYRWNTGYQPPLNEWTHITFSRDSSGRYLYVNGALENSTTSSGGSSMADTVLRLGADTQDNRYNYQGIMDEVLFFNTALNSTQVNELYNTSTPLNTPDDVLYAVQISTDNFTSDIRYIDGSTNEPKSDLTLNDFRTKTQWEGETFNILGLEENTEYSIRILALHGDFTQTEEGPPEVATTAGSTSIFDIDVADNSGYTTESDPPFNILFSGDSTLLPGASTVVANNLIWLDATTNGSGGFAIVQRGQNGGLYSPSLAAQIDSLTGDLDALAEGFGLQNYYIDYDTSSGLGEITAMADYNGNTSNVGIVGTDWNKIYDGNGPIAGGRMGLYLMAKAAADKQGANDYTETITFILIPRY